MQGSGTCGAELGGDGSLPEQASIVDVSPNSAARKTSIVSGRTRAATS
jgi:hypothetical protein